MPGSLLHEGATILCLHGGQAQATMSSPRVKVGGQPVVTQTAPHSVASCPFIKGSSPSPCGTAQWVSAALRVKVGGTPVLLQDSKANCMPNGTGVNIVMSQTRVKGK